MDSDYRAHWEQTHASKAPHEVSWYQAKPEPSLSMILAAGLAMDDGIIDVGAGASNLIDHLLDAGFRHVTCLDISEKALSIARARLGSQRAAEVTWIVADITQWAAPSVGSFALWHDRAAFHFLNDSSDRKAYAQSMAKAVRPGGTAIIATFAMDGPQRCSNLDVRRSESSMIAAEFGDAFTLLGERHEAHVTPWGAEQRFVWFTLRRKN